MGTNRLLALASIPLVIVAVAAARDWSEDRADNWTRPRPVRIESNADVQGILPDAVSPLSTDAATGVRGLLLRDGDLILSAEYAAPMVYRTRDGASLRLKFEEWRTSLGDEIVGLALASYADERRDDALDWAERASDAELRRLRFVLYEGSADPIWPRTLRALDRIAAVNPTIGLAVTGEPELVLEGLSRFRPRALFMECDSASVQPLRAWSGLRDVEVLSLKESDASCLELIAATPRLRQLSVPTWEHRPLGAHSRGVPPLRSLVVTESITIDDLAALSEASGGLEELTLGAGNAFAVSSLERLPTLRRLILGDMAPTGGLDPLRALKGLRWISIPSTTTQQQFADFIAAHRELEIVELLGAKDVTDLAPLAELKHLSSLTLDLVTRYSHVDVVHSSKRLRYIGIRTDTSRASLDRVAAIRAARPEALVVGVRPMCMGAGWIVLLIPAIALFWVVTTRARFARAAAVRVA